MSKKEAPPGPLTPSSEHADGGGVTGKRRLANPEKSGDAKPRNYGADLTAGQGALCPPGCEQSWGNPAAQR